MRLQVDFFDASGTLFSMANFVNNFLPGVILPCSHPIPFNLFTD